MLRFLASTYGTKVLDFQQNTYWLLILQEIECSVEKGKLMNALCFRADF
jgi:hypothetical protein